MEHIFPASSYSLSIRATLQIYWKYVGARNDANKVD